jgi:hypothetical protein
VEALDGNAIAGQLYEYFGHEMTMTTGTCAHCRNPSLVAELAVYLRCPGSVARCPTCGNVVMVVVDIRGTLRLDHSNFEFVQ